MKELPGRHPPPRRPRRSARSSRETASRPRSKPPHVRLVFRDPAGNLIGRERSRLGEQGALGPESRRQKEHQFLLLGRRECRGGRFDFGKSEHGHRRTPYSAHLPRESAARCRNRHGTGRVLFGRWAARERARLAAVRAVSHRRVRNVRIGAGSVSNDMNRMSPPHAGHWSGNASPGRP